MGLVAFKYEATIPPGLILDTKTYLQSNFTVLLLLIFGPGIIVLGTSLAIRRVLFLEQETLESDGPLVMSVLTSINKFVAEKFKRFGTCAARFESPSSSAVTKSKIFEEITQPDEQISEIVSQLHVALQFWTQDETLKVVLVELPSPIVGEDFPIYACCSPIEQPPTRSLLHELWSDSFFHAVASGTRPRIISDIGKLLASRTRDQTFVATTDDKEYVGSIIGFPLHNPFLERITHVMTVRSLNPKNLSEDFKKRYSKYIEFFFTRIHLEYNLKIIKHASA